MSRYKPSKPWKGYNASTGETVIINKCVKCDEQAEQIADMKAGLDTADIRYKTLMLKNQRLKEIIMHTHDTLLSVRGNCECDNAKIFKIRQEHKQALAAQPQGGE